MPLEKLQKQILDDARRQARVIENDAKRQAESIIRSARERAGEIRKNGEKETRREVVAAAEEERANAELMEMSILLDARGKAVETVMPHLKRMAIGMIKRRGYGRFINMAVEEAGSVAREGTLTMVVGRNDARLVKNFDGRIRYGEVGSGIELVSKDGKVKIRATLEEIFDANSRKIETMLMREMFTHKKVRRQTATKKAKLGRRARRAKRKRKG